MLQELRLLRGLVSRLSCRSLIVVVSEGEVTELLLECTPRENSSVGSVGAAPDVAMEDSEAISVDEK